MGCCDKNKSTRNEREIPDGLEPCCTVVHGQRCMCLPYDDPWLIVAQILTIVSVFFAWICWVTFLVGFIGLILFQVLWCVRMRGGPLVSHMVLAGLTSAANLGIAIYILIDWKRKSWCHVFVLYADDDDWRRIDDVFDDNYYDDDIWDDCQEKTWFAVAFVCALLWAAAMFCMIWFVKSGRHAKWEKKHSTAPLLSSTEVEITATPSNANGDTTGGGDDAVVADASVLETEKEDSVE